MVALKCILTLLVAFLFALNGRSAVSDLKIYEEDNNAIAKSLFLPPLPRFPLNLDDFASFIEIQNKLRQIDEREVQIIIHLAQDPLVDAAVNRWLSSLDVLLQVLSHWEERPVAELYYSISTKYVPSIAGFNGGVSSLKEIVSGSLREKLTFIFASMGMVGTNLATLDQVNAKNELLVKIGIKNHSFRFLAGCIDESGKENPFRLGYYSNFQAHTREQREDDFAMSLKAKFNPKIDEKFAIPFSDRERLAQGIEGGERVQWNQGCHHWVAHSYTDRVHEEVQNERALAYFERLYRQGLNTVAGVSGTADRLLTHALMIGVADEDLTLCLKAICAYLVDIKAHSLIECLESARSFRPFKDKNLYQQFIDESYFQNDVE